MNACAGWSAVQIWRYCCCNGRNVCVRYTWLWNPSLFGPIYAFLQSGQVNLYTPERAKLSRLCEYCGKKLTYKTVKVVPLRISPTVYFYCLPPLQVYYTKCALLNNQEDNIYIYISYQTSREWTQFYITRWYKLPRSRMQLKYYFSTSRYIYDSTKIALPSTVKKINFYIPYNL